jgi:AbrB family looped-hinge helix DNA binding protein
MTTSIVSTKGQIVIPAEIRAELGIGAGSRVEFIKTEEGWLLKPATLPVTVLKGVLAKPGRKVLVEDMNRAIRHRAGRCEAVYTFDKKAARKTDCGMTLVR